MSPEPKNKKIKIMSVISNRKLLNRNLKTANEIVNFLSEDKINGSYSTLRFNVGVDFFKKHGLKIYNLRHTFTREFEVVEVLREKGYNTSDLFYLEIEKDIFMVYNPISRCLNASSCYKKVDENTFEFYEFNYEFIDTKNEYYDSVGM